MVVDVTQVFKLFITRLTFVIRAMPIFYVPLKQGKHFTEKLQTGCIMLNMSILQAARNMLDMSSIF